MAEVARSSRLSFYDIKLGCTEIMKYIHYIYDQIHTMHALQIVFKNNYSNVSKRKTAQNKKSVIKNEKNN